MFLVIDRDNMVMAAFVGLACADLACADLACAELACDELACDERSLIMLAVFYSFRFDKISRRYDFSIGRFISRV